MRTRLAIPLITACLALAAAGGTAGAQTSVSTPAATAGAVSASTPPATTPPVTAAVPVTPTAAAPPAPATAPTATGSSHHKLAVALLAAVGALLLAAALLWALGRWLVWEPTWLLRSRHATAEAGWRTSAAWSEFRDWLRLGH